MAAAPRTTSTTGTPLMPGGLPLAGHAIQLRRKPLEFLRTVRYYGDVVRVRVGPTPAYVVNSPDLVHEVLVTRQHCFGSGPMFDNARAVIGNGIAVSDGYLHHRQRRLVQPAFNHQRLGWYADTMADIAKARSASWRAGDTINLKEELFAIAMEIFAKVLFSADAGRANIADFHRFWPIILTSMTSRTKRYDEARERCRAAVARIVTHHRKTGTDHGDVLSALLAASDHPNGFMTDEQVIDEVMSLLAAGTLAPCATIGWMFYHFSADRAVERRVHAELAATLAGRSVTHVDLARLRYLDRVVSETLRMHPPAWLLTRRALSEVVLGEHRIPAGSSVTFSPYAMHHDGGLFVHAEHFDPDRWLPERAKSIPRHAYVPFGDGDRRCIGAAFARMQVLIVAAAIAARWTLRLPAGEQIHEIPATVLTANRLALKLHRRS